MLFGFFQGRQLVKVQHLAVHPKAHVALRLHGFKGVGEFALALTRHRGQHHPAAVDGQLQYGVHHLSHGLGLQGQLVLGAVGRARPRKQQAQVIVNFGHRAYCGARVVAGGFLLDADGGRQAFNQVHIGLVHQLQKLTRVGGQAFHIAALPLGIKSVKRQAGLARAAQTRDDHQLVARYVQVDVFQVVRARTSNVDGLRL